MHVLLKRIRETTTVADVENFLYPALLSGFLRKTGRIESLVIQKIQLSDSSCNEYNVIVRIEPETVAKRVKR